MRTRGFSKCCSRQAVSGAQGGFTLVEALVALLVLAFGLLAVASFQVTLNRNADVARQRAEAVRIAQKDMEALRAFTQKAAAGGVTSYDGSIVDQAPTDVVGFSSNTTYRLSRKVVAVAGGEHKSIEVLVTWLDRAGAQQQVNLASVIAAYEPSSITLLATGSGLPKTRRPKNRDINIPYPSVSMQGGKSGFTPPGESGFYFVFNDVTGNVVAKCSDLVGNPLVAGGAACTSNMNGFLLAGYVRFLYGDSSQNSFLPKVANPTDDTKPLHPNYNSTTPSAPQPFTIDADSTALAYQPTYQCFSERRVDLTDGTTAPDTGQSSGSVWSRYIAYVCIVQPPTVSGLTAWSGKVSVVTNGSWTIGTSAGEYVVCRYSADTANNGFGNNDHPLHYRQVTGSMDNQSFLVIDAKGNGNSANACPSDGAATPLTGDFSISNTVAHQPTGALSVGEPTVLDTLLPMF